MILKFGLLNQINIHVYKLYKLVNYYNELHKVFLNISSIFKNNLAIDEIIPLC